MITRMDMTEPSMQVGVIEDEEGFDALREDWLALEHSDTNSSLFMSWEAQRLWWKHYGKGRELRILLARSAGRVVGIWPLYCERQRKAGGIVSIRKLRQMGIGGDTAPDDLDALLLPEFKAETAVHLVRFVAGSLKRWDMLELTDVPAASPLLPSLLEELPKIGIRVQRSVAKPIVQGELPRSFDEYCHSLSSNRRQVMRRKRRKFEAQSGARFMVIQEASELDAAFEELVRLHRLRWSGRTLRPAFSSSEFRSYHREWMHSMLPQGRLRLMSLEIGGKCVAMLYCMQYKKRLNFFQGGFDPTFSSLSPGDVLMSYAVELAIAEGCTVFDMLKGDHEYKRHFFQQERRNLEIRAFRKGAVNMAYGLRDIWLRYRPARAAADHAAA